MSDTPRGARYLDDFMIGMRFVSHTHTMTEAQIIAFAREFDPQPFHTDPVAAETSLFRGLAASGWHTAAVSMRLFVDLQIGAADGMIGAGVENLRWPLPVRPNDTLRVESEVVSVRPSNTRPERGIVVFDVITRNQHGEIVQSYRPSCLVPTRPAS